jgi:PmbA protein
MNYLQLVQEVVAALQEEGAAGDAYLTVGKETEIDVVDARVEKLSYAGSKGLGVRALVDHKTGYAYTSDLTPASVQQVVRDALELAAASDADEYRTLPEPQPIDAPDLAIYDPAMLTTPTDAKVAFAEAMAQAALAADPRVVLVPRAKYMDAVGDVFLANSNGFSGSYQKSMAAAFLQAMAAEGEERAMGTSISVDTSLANLDAVAIGADAATKAAGLLGGRPVPTQRATVVYSPWAASGLVGALARALTGEAMQRNRSFLQGKMGADVASDVVSVLDNGRLRGGIATRPFDGEGTPTRATRLIDEGLLQAVLHDAYSAARQGTDSSGNASRSSHRSAPALAPSNFYIQPGPTSPEELIAGVDEGLYVVDTMNTHSINPVSGDYSVSAQGYWIKDGKLTFPVNNVTIALPLAELLKNVRAVGNDLHFFPFGGAIGSPTFRVDGVMIGGSG